MAALINQALATCPKTKIIASGYSQGAMVVHNAFSAQGINKHLVKGVVLFGDPFIPSMPAVGDMPPGRVKSFCATGDLVCELAIFNVTAAHLSYGANAQEAANFIISVTS